MSRSIQRQFIKILQARQKAKEEECGRGRRGNLIPIPYLTLGTTITAAPTALATLATLASHSVGAPTSSPWSHCLIWWQPVDIDSSQEWRRRRRRRQRQRKALFHGHFHISNGVLWVCRTLLLAPFAAVSSVILRKQAKASQPLQPLLLPLFYLPLLTLTCLSLVISICRADKFLATDFLLICHKRKRRSRRWRWQAKSLWQREKSYSTLYDSFSDTIAVHIEKPRNMSSFKLLQISKYKLKYCIAFS